MNTCMYDLDCQEKRGSGSPPFGGNNLELESIACSGQRMVRARGHRSSGLSSSSSRIVPICLILVHLEERVCTKI